MVTGGSQVPGKGLGLGVPDLGLRVTPVGWYRDIVYS